MTAPAGRAPREHGLPAGRRVASVEVAQEAETDRGWRYTLTVVWMDDTQTDHAMSLSWHDHDHWSGGTVPPSRVAGAVLRAAGERLGREALPAQTDAATLRRLVPDLDETLRL